MVGANAFIGLRAIVLPGVTIGRKAVVGAGSVVTRDVGEGQTVAGNPRRTPGKKMSVSPKVPLSVLIPVKNEAANLPRCLAAVAWAAEIFVVDSTSTDGTQGIAEQHGAKVVQFQYGGGWPKKKEWSLRHLPFTHDWVLLLDADEVMPPGAEYEIRQIVADTSRRIYSGYWINRRFFFLGQMAAARVFSELGTCGWSGTARRGLSAWPRGTRKAGTTRCMNIFW